MKISSIFVAFLENMNFNEWVDVEMKIKMIIVQAVQMINPNEVLDSIDFKISLISFYCPVLHFAVWIFIEIFQLNDFKFVLHSMQVICFINKEISEEKLKLLQASSFIFSIIFTVWKFTCIYAFSRNLGDFSNEINQIDFASIEGKLPFVVRSA